MERFLEPIEASQYLGVAVKDLKKMDIHKCPYGYSMDCLNAFIKENGLPIHTDIQNIVVIGYEDHPHIICKNLTEALFKASTKTSAIISNKAFTEEAYNVATQHGIKLLKVGEGSEYCHISLPSFREAVDMAET